MMARRELKLSSRDQGKLVERNPLYPEGDRALLLQTLPSLSSEGFSRWSLECPWSLPAPSWSHFRQCCGSWAAPQTSPCPSGEWVRRCWLLASRCLLPWLGRDSSHPRFLPQRARGTDPVLVLEGRGVSQTLRGVCVGSDGELGGCGFVVTLWRKVPSCMALLCPVRSCSLCSGHSPCTLGPTQMGSSLAQGRGSECTANASVAGGRKEEGVCAGVLSHPVAGTRRPGLLRAGPLHVMFWLFPAQP